MQCAFLSHVLSVALLHSSTSPHHVLLPEYPEEQRHSKVPFRLTHLQRQSDQLRKIIKTERKNAYKKKDSFTQRHLLSSRAMGQSSQKEGQNNSNVEESGLFSEDRRGICPHYPQLQASLVHSDALWLATM